VIAIAAAAISRTMMRDASRDVLWIVDRLLVPCELITR
jgi:hypothetical protein